MIPNWDAIVEAVEALRSNPGMQRIDGVRQDKDCYFKVYRVAGDTIRIDIKPQEAGNGKIG